jgi:L-serine dehydratase
MGLEGAMPETIDPDQIGPRADRIRSEEVLHLLGQRAIALRPSKHLIFHALRSLPKHPNGMRFVALDAAGVELVERTYYSVGGGFVVGESTSSDLPPVPMREEGVPHPFTTAAELLAQCGRRRASISALMLDNLAGDAGLRCPRLPARGRPARGPEIEAASPFAPPPARQRRSG